MRPQYNSVLELIRAIGSREFRVRYCLSKKEIHLEDYQDLFRIYLDECSEQKELRQEWFEKNHDIFKHIYTRFLRRH